MTNPGPGQYNGDKAKRDNIQYSIGAKLPNGMKGLNVPGPGTYEQKGSLEIIEKAPKFGNGQRSNLGIKLN